MTSRKYNLYHEEMEQYLLHELNSNTGLCLQLSDLEEMMIHSKLSWDWKNNYKQPGLLINKTPIESFEELQTLHPELFI